MIAEMYLREPFPSIKSEEEIRLGTIAYQSMAQCILSPRGLLDFLRGVIS